MKRFLSALGLCWVLAGCGSNASLATGATGVQGFVTIGPTCPVERINSPCPPRPIAATVIASDPSGKEISRTQSGSDGHFKLALNPGSYTLSGQRPANQALPRPIPQTVIVSSGGYTVVTLQFDSGIR